VTLGFGRDSKLYDHERSQPTEVAKPPAEPRNHCHVLLGGEIREKARAKCLPHHERRIGHGDQKDGEPDISWLYKVEACCPKSANECTTAKPALLVTSVVTDRAYQRREQDRE